MFPIKLPASVQSMLRNYDDSYEEGSYFYLLGKMYHSNIAEDKEQLARLITEIGDQIDSGGILNERISDCYDPREAIGLRAQARGLKIFRDKYK